MSVKINERSWGEGAAWWSYPWIGSSQTRKFILRCIPMRSMCMRNTKTNVKSCHMRIGGMTQSRSLTLRLRIFFLSFSATCIFSSFLLSSENLRDKSRTVPAESWNEFPLQSQNTPLCPSTFLSVFSCIQNIFCGWIRRFLSPFYATTIVENRCRL